jgi:PTH1 family peptidyl-tRNA hydrolase
MNDESHIAHPAESDSTEPPRVNMTFQNDLNQSSDQNLMMVIVGLGNPGKKYMFTRHNIGFMTIDRLAQQWEIGCSKKKFDAIIGEGFVDEKRILIAKPQTYVNRSGVSVVKIGTYYGCPLDNLMVVCDDLNLPVGKIRIRKKGSSGGHNGLESIAQYVGPEFPRLRIGIGQPTYEDAKDYVLSPIRGDEKEVIDQAIDKACQAINAWITTGIEDCINVFN